MRSIVEYVARLRLRRDESPEAKLLRHLRKRVFKNRCPVCNQALDTRHSMAEVGACPVPAPNPQLGFLNEVRLREWGEVTRPWIGSRDQDAMMCEVVQCPRGFGLIVMVEFDLVGYIKQEEIFRESILSKEFAEIGKHKQLQWHPFPD